MPIRLPVALPPRVMKADIVERGHHRDEEAPSAGCHCGKQDCDCQSVADSETLVGSEAPDDDDDGDGSYALEDRYDHDYVHGLAHGYNMDF